VAKASIKERAKGYVFKRRQLEADIAHITEEMYRRNVELAHTNKTLAILRSIDTLVLDPENTVVSLAQAICNELHKENNYTFVGIATRGARREKFILSGISTVDYAAKQPQYMGVELTVREEFIDGPEHETLYLNGTHGSNLDDHLGVSAALLKRNLTKLGVHRIVVNKLASHDKILGLLIVGFAETVD
jgi:hypothetical protein